MDGPRTVESNECAFKLVGDKEMRAVNGRLRELGLKVGGTSCPVAENGQFQMCPYVPLPIGAINQL